MKPLSLLIAFLMATYCYGQSTERLIVKFKASTNYRVVPTENKIVTTDLVLKDAIDKVHLTKIISLVPVTAAESNLRSLHLVKHIHFFEMLPGTDIQQVKILLEETGLFEYVENDHVGKGSGVSAVTPTDTYFNRQWGLYNDGTFSASAISGADVKMTEAWGLTTGSSSVIVCILDSGLKLDHPEFSGRLWVNPSEIANNNIDDDGNGYIDDVNGWDWANNDKNPTDDHGHGTNVAGITAASGNNSTGYAGVDWNCKVMTGKILNASNSGSYSWFASGIYYAVNKGARVINMSVGGSGFSQSLKDACDFAYANNVALFACMMNENNGVSYYPAAYSSTIAVGATDVNDYRVQPFFWSTTSGSNYGSHIDVVAPGNYIYGLSYSSNTNYNSYWGGTSQATPLVAGIGSLMVALNPSITVDEIRSKLRSTAVDLVGRPTEDVAGFDNYMGYGRVNAYAALAAVILPVKATKLEGVLNKEMITLSWKTFHEVNADKFIIEISKDIVNWEPVGEVKAKGTAAEYTWQHSSPLKGVSFYRYRQVDRDGRSEYSNIVRIWNEKAGFVIKANSPANEVLNININSLQNTSATLSLFNAAGILVKTLPLKLSEGNNYLEWNISSLPKGQYVLACRIPSGEQQVISIIK